MSDRMRPLSFAQIVQCALSEWREQKQIFGLKETHFFRPRPGVRVQTALGDRLATSIGPAAGPHAQMAPNILLSYLSGARFMELKTVQKLDGETIREAVKKPCIWAEDEAYNCEWSTELTVEEAFDEYVKAWFAIQALAPELGLAEEIDFAFNMSVGYDLEGIRLPKIDRFIEGLKDASKEPIFQECRQWLLDNLGLFQNLTAEKVKAIPAQIAHSITLSTLHGCPPQEIERIAAYLLEEKKLDTFVKCNPTLLGYDFARQLLDEYGFSYMAFSDLHFREDMQYADALAMIGRLRRLADGLGRVFGLKLSNTFPVDVTRGELPSEEMYMSGRALHLLTAHLALHLSRDLNGELPISFSGGADALNMAELLATGIGPVTLATTLLKPGGYARFQQMALLSVAAQRDYAGIDLNRLERYVAALAEEPRYRKADRGKAASRKTDSELPLWDCFKAPCQDGGCPLGQQIPEYLKLVSEGRMAEAMRVISLDNTAPSITGTLCPQPCRSRCTRLDYESPLQMRQEKLRAAEAAQELQIQATTAKPLACEKKALIIGAGPAGLAAALFLRRNGLAVCVREKETSAYGLVRQLIPAFRITDEAIDRDLALALAEGVEIEYAADPRLDLREAQASYDFILLAVGAACPGPSPVQEGSELVIDALDFLRQAKQNGSYPLGHRVAVVGGGDVAMDCARQALRQPGVEAVTLIYRRGREDMPALQEDLDLTRAEGVGLREYVQPIRYDGKSIQLEKMQAVGREPSGRRVVQGSGEYLSLPFDSLIAATGARVNRTFYEALGLNLDERGRVRLDEHHESSEPGVFVIGDGRRGPATIVQAIADAKTAAREILRRSGLKADFDEPELRQRSLRADQAAIGEQQARRAVLKASSSGPEEGRRCLACDLLCEICTELCPNRANVAIPLPGHRNPRQIVHIDRLCNECGNCAVFCPHAGKPYRDKWTLFACEADFRDSENPGWLPLADRQILRRSRQGVEARGPLAELPADEQRLIEGLAVNGYLTGL